MGQLALGFRSLLLRLAVFFVMAVLLAWALGGTLWPRAESVNLEPTAYAGREWFWELSVGGRVPGHVRWTLMAQGPGEDAAPVDDRTWAWGGGIVALDEALYFAARTSPEAGGAWQVERITAEGERRAYAMPDRLAVERQLARVAAGLEIQDAEAIARDRSQVLGEAPSPES